MNPRSSAAPRSADAGPLGAVFAARARRGQSALVPYVCAGFPDRDATLELLLRAADAGADVLELGLPFSDPLADGPTIQRAAFRALEQGTTVHGALEILAEFRARRDVPVVLFSYLNPVHHYGLERFVADAREAGAQGLLLTDLPAGADPPLEAQVRDGGLELIRLVAPTTAPARVPVIAEGAGGFVYYISRTGVTGARSELRTELKGEIEALRASLSLPIAVGFGISTPAQAGLVAGLADGVVVGSALVEAVDRGGPAAGEAFLRSLRSAMDAAGMDAAGGAPGRTGPG